MLAVQVPREATFCARLQDRLNAAAPAGVRYRVINAGVQGYGPVEELLFYRHVAARFEADLVLVATFVANDAVEAFDAAWRLDGSRPPAVAVRDETERTLRRVVRRSMVLQIARQRVDQLRDRAGATAAPSRPVASYLVTPPPFITDGLDVATRALGTLSREVRAGRRPPGDRADAGALPARSGRVRAAARRDRADGRADRASTPRPSASAPPLAPLGVPTIDLLPVLRVGAARPVLRRAPCTSPPTGHETVAAALEAFIRREHLLRRPARRATRR